MILPLKYKEVMKDFLMNFRDFFSNHSIFGKIIGAILGFIMAGPIGAFIGLVIGNFFDKGLAQQFSNPHWSFKHEARNDVKTAFIHATFSSMGYIAKANGRITENVITHAKQMMDEMDLTKAQKITAQHFFNAGKQSQFNLNATVLTFKTCAYENTELLNLFATILYNTAQVDGLSMAKIKRLNEIFSLMNFAPLHSQAHFYDDFFHRHSYQDDSSREEEPRYRYQSSQSTPHYRGSLSEAYALLNLTANATQHEVKRVYRKMMSQNHPDKLIAKGASEKEIKIANEKTQAIRRAYEQICESRGW